MRLDMQVTMAYDDDAKMKMKREKSEQIHK